MKTTKKTKKKLRIGKDKKNMQKYLFYTKKNFKTRNKGSLRDAPKMVIKPCTMKQ